MLPYVYDFELNVARGAVGIPPCVEAISLDESSKWILTPPYRKRMRPFSATPREVPCLANGNTCIVPGTGIASESYDIS